MPQERPFQRPKRVTFPIEGVDVNVPIDSPKSWSKAARLKNLTVESDGSLVIRPGLVALYSTVVTSKTPVHSLRRLSDPSGTYALIAGVQDRLAKDTNGSGTFTDLDGPYSGNPMTILPWRPAQSTKSHAYVYDSSRQRKVAVDGSAVKSIGIPAPTIPPVCELSVLLWGSPMFLTGSAAGWTDDGSVIDSGITNEDRHGGSGTAITRIVVDSVGSWACVQPANLTDVGTGTAVRHLSAGPVLTQRFVAEVHRGSAATSIKSILYDSGSTGLCTIHPTTSTEEFRRNALVQVGSGGGAEYVRIIETIAGPDGSHAIRCSLTGTHSATETLQVVDSYRAWGAASETDLYGYGLEWTNSTTGPVYNSGKGYVQKIGLSEDLTKIPDQYGSLDSAPFTDEDYFHISLKCDNWDKVSLVRVLFDIDDESFEENFYWYGIEQNRLVAATQGTQTPTEAQRRGINRRALEGPISRDYDTQDPFLPGVERIERFLDHEGKPTFRNPVPVPGSPSVPEPAGEGGTGKNQWAEIIWKRGEMNRAGSDESKGWDTIKGLRIEVTYSSATRVDMWFGSLNVFGGGGPDIGEEGFPYIYRYRYRDPETGTVSDYSPASRSGLLSFRTDNVVQVTGANSSYKIDIERFGGLQNGWYYVGTVDDPGASSTTTFTDTLSDIAALRNAGVSNRRIIQPWARNQIPISSSVSTADVAGSAIEVDGADALSTSIVPGTVIIVDGVANRLRRPLNASGGTATRWELEDSMGTRANVDWEIPNPVYSGQPLGRVFGPFNNAFFACDGIYVRWTEGNDPDATHVTSYVEVTDPTDVTMGGFVFNGRAGVLTTRRLFAIDGDPVRGFSFTEVPFGKGLFTPYGLAIGPAIAWISRDGIYESTGSTPHNITTTDLAPLFPLEGRPGTDTNGLSAPDIDSSEQSYLRLAYLDDGSLMFTYRDNSGNRHHLRYTHDTGRWYPYDYKKTLTQFYSLEGDGVTGLIAGGADATTGKIYTVGGSTNPTTDDGTGFDCQIRTFSDDFGDPRSRKYLGDLIVDADPASHTTGIATTLYRDNETLSTSLGNITGASRTQKLFDLGSGDGLRAKNFALDLAWTTEANKKQRLYLYEMALLPRPETISLRATDYESGGFDGDKYMQGIRITADTFNVAKTLRIEYDGGQLGQTLTITHNGLRTEHYSFDTPFIARLVRIATADTDTWELYNYEYVFNPEPPSAKVWWIQFTGFDIPGYKHCYHIRPAIACPADVTMTLYADTQASSYHSDTIAATGGDNYTFMRRPTHIVPAKKLKLFAAKFVSATPFRLYLADTEVLVKGWAHNGDYQLLRPFGAPHRTEGARI